MKCPWALQPIPSPLTFTAGWLTCRPSIFLSGDANPALQRDHRLPFSIVAVSRRSAAGAVASTAAFGTHGSQQRVFSAMGTFFCCNHDHVIKMSISPLTFWSRWKLFYMVSQGCLKPVQQNVIFNMSNMNGSQWDALIPSFQMYSCSHYLSVMLFFYMWRQTLTLDQVKTLFVLYIVNITFICKQNELVWVLWRFLFACWLKPKLRKNTF